jgi:hypothetical protein
VIVGYGVDHFYHNPFAIIWIMYTFLPLFDFIISVDGSNLPPKLLKKYQNEWKFLLPLYTFVVLDFFIYAYFMFYRMQDERIKNSYTLQFLFIFAYG